MPYPGGSWREGWFQKTLRWLAIAVVLLWLGRFLLGGSHEGLRRISLSGGNLILIALGLALGGVVLWKALIFFFWRKYFPTQSPPEPPAQDRHQDGSQSSHLPREERS